jgi:hypothetical protein
MAAQTVADTFACRAESAKARTARGRLASGAIASGTFGRTATNESKSIPRREKSCSHAQAKPLNRLFTSS